MCVVVKGQKRGLDAVPVKDSSNVPEALTLGTVRVVALAHDPFGTATDLQFPQTPRRQVIISRGAGFAPELPVVP